MNINDFVLEVNDFADSVIAEDFEIDCITFSVSEEDEGISEEDFVAYIEFHGEFYGKRKDYKMQLCVDTSEDCLAIIMENDANIVEADAKEFYRYMFFHEILA